jgi:hypothetical protein
MDLPQINKLRIISIPDLSGPMNNIGSDIAKVGRTITSTVFEVQLNPDQIKRNIKIKYKTEPTNGTAQNTLQFEGTESEVLELKFHLDGTGILPKNVGGDLLGNALNANGADLAYVEMKILQLKLVVYDFIDETHRTPFLLVNWGTFTFYGVLESMEYTYNLFHPSGVPLRAEVNLKIKEHSTGKKDLDAVLSFLSPDLTRRHTFLSSDTILTVCHAVYSDEKYYLEIAKANKMVNFRGIEPNTVLQLPSIEK